jgi:hypothetical protein
MNAKQVWVIFLNKSAAEVETLEMMPDIDNLETVRVNGKLGLPVFTSRQKAEQYGHTLLLTPRRRRPLPIACRRRNYMRTLLPS